MKTIGLIGGMSWESSAEYYRMINEVVRRRLEGFHSAQCLMFSVDFADIEEPRGPTAGKTPATGSPTAPGALSAVAPSSSSSARTRCTASPTTLPRRPRSLPPHRRPDRG
jgi:hypothetical protein